MANNTVQFTIDVNGNLAQSAAQATTLNQQMQQAATASRSIGGTAAIRNRIGGGTFGGGRGSEPPELPAGLGRGSAAGNARGDSRDFARQAQGLGGLVHLYATFAANIFAVVTAFSALDKAMRVEGMMKALELSSARAGINLKQLGKEIKEISGGAIAQQDIVRFTNMGAAVGMTSSRMKDIAVVAKGASAALGRDMADSMDRLVRGITKMEPELLDELGILTKAGDAYKQYAKEMGISKESMSGLQRQQAFANAVLAEGTAKWKAYADALPVNPMAQLSASISEGLTKSLIEISKILGPVAELFAKNGELIAIGLGMAVAKGLKMAIPVFGDMRLAAQKEAEAARKNLEESKQRQFFKQNPTKSKEYDNAIKEEISARGNLAQLEAKYNQQAVASAERLKRIKDSAAAAGVSNLTDKSSIRDLSNQTTLNKLLKEKSSLQDKIIANEEKLYVAQQKGQTKVVENAAKQTAAYEKQILHIEKIEAELAKELSLLQKIEAQQNGINIATAKQEAIRAEGVGKASKWAEFRSARSDIGTNFQEQRRTVGLGAATSQAFTAEKAAFSAAGFGVFSGAASGAATGVRLLGTAMSGVLSFMTGPWMLGLTAVVMLFDMFGPSIGLANKHLGELESKLDNLTGQLDTMSASAKLSLDVIASARSMDEIFSVDTRSLASIEQLTANLLQLEEAAKKAAAGGFDLMDTFKKLWGGDVASKQEATKKRVKDITLETINLLSASRKSQLVDVFNNLSNTKFENITELTDSIGNLNTSQLENLGKATGFVRGEVDKLKEATKSAENASGEILKGILNKGYSGAFKADEAALQPIVDKIGEYNTALKQIEVLKEKGKNTTDAEILALKNLTGTITPEIIEQSLKLHLISKDQAKFLTEEIDKRKALLDIKNKEVLADQKKAALLKDLTLVNGPRQVTEQDASGVWASRNVATAKEAEKAFDEIGFQISKIVGTQKAYNEVIADESATNLQKANAINASIVILEQLDMQIERARLFWDAMTAGDSTQNAAIKEKFANIEKMADSLKSKLINSFGANKDNAGIGMGFNAFIQQEMAKGRGLIDILGQIEDRYRKMPSVGDKAIDPAKAADATNEKLKNQLAILKEIADIYKKAADLASKAGKFTEARWNIQEWSKAATLEVNASYDSDAETQKRVKSSNEFAKVASKDPNTYRDVISDIEKNQEIPEGSLKGEKLKQALKQYLLDAYKVAKKNALENIKQEKIEYEINAIVKIKDVEVAKVKSNIDFNEKIRSILGSSTPESEKIGNNLTVAKKEQEQLKDALTEAKKIAGAENSKAVQDLAISYNRVIQEVNALEAAQASAFKVEGLKRYAAELGVAAEQASDLANRVGTDNIIGARANLDAATDNRLKIKAQGDADIEVASRDKKDPVKLQQAQAKALRDNAKAAGEYAVALSRVGRVNDKLFGPKGLKDMERAAKIWKDFGDSAKDAFKDFGKGFQKVGEGLQKFSASISESLSVNKSLNEQQVKSDETRIQSQTELQSVYQQRMAAFEGIEDAGQKRALQEAALADLTTQSAEVQKKSEQELKDIQIARSSQALTDIATQANAIGSMFGKHTGMAKAMMALERTAHMAKMAMMLAQLPATIATMTANISAGVAALFAQGGWAGFAGAAAFLALMASLGAKGGGGGGGAPNIAEDRQKSQGTGTVKGDASAKSESLKKSQEVWENDILKQTEQGNVMITLLASIDRSIAGVSNNWVGTIGKPILAAQNQVNLGSSGSWGGRDTGKKIGFGAELGASAGLAMMGPAGLAALAGGLVLSTILGGAVGGLFGKKVSREQVDSGIRYQGTVGDASADQYATIRTTTKRKSWGRSKTSVSDATYFQENQGLSEGIGNVFRSIGESIISGVDILGFKTEAAAANFRDTVMGLDLGTNMVSLQGIAANKINETLQNALSAKSDTLVEQALGNIAAGTGTKLVDVTRSETRTRNEWRAMEGQAATFLGGRQETRYFTEQVEVQRTLADEMSELQQVGEGMYETFQRVTAATSQSQAVLRDFGITMDPRAWLELTEADAGKEAEALVKGYLAGNISDINETLGDVFNQITGSVEDLVKWYSDLRDANDALKASGLSGDFSFDTLAGAGSFDAIQKGLSTLREGNAQQEFAFSQSKVARFDEKLNNDAATGGGTLAQAGYGVGKTIAEINANITALDAQRQLIDTSTESGKALAKDIDYVIGVNIAAADSVKQLEEAEKALAEQTRNTAKILLDFMNVVEQAFTDYFDSLNVSSNLSGLSSGFADSMLNLNDSFASTKEELEAALSGPELTAAIQQITDGFNLASEMIIRTLLQKVSNAIDENNARFEAYSGEGAGLGTAVTRADSAQVMVGDMLESTLGAGFDLSAVTMPNLLEWSAQASRDISAQVAAGVLDPAAAERALSVIGAATDAKFKLLDALKEVFDFQLQSAETLKGRLEAVQGIIKGNKGKISELKDQIGGAGTVDARLADLDAAIADATSKYADAIGLGNTEEAVEIATELNDMVVSRFDLEMENLDAVIEKQKEYYDNTKDFLAEVSDYVKGLDLSDNSTLSIKDKLDQAQAEFQSNLAIAQDTTGTYSQEQVFKARENLTGSADQLLGFAKEYGASGTLYQQIYDSVKTGLGGLEATLGPTIAVDPEEQRNQLMQAQITTLEGMNTQLATLETAISTDLNETLAQLAETMQQLATNGFPMDGLTQALSTALGGTTATDILSGITVPGSQTLDYVRGNINTGGVLSAGDTYANQQLTSATTGTVTTTSGSLQAPTASSAILGRALTFEQAYNVGSGSANLPGSGGTYTSNVPTMDFSTQAIVDQLVYMRAEIVKLQGINAAGFTDVVEAELATEAQSTSNEALIQRLQSGADAVNFIRQ